MDTVLAALAMLADPWVILVILMASALGLFVGAMPGLTAAMAIALLVPVTLYMEPLPALAMIVSLSCMAIFAGDIPSALLRIPGTLASAAYAEEAYAMAQNGKAETALGASAVFSAIGGIFGTLVLIVAAPELARIALKFSSFEYFWLVCLGLSCAVLVGSGSVLKSLISLMLGLIAGMVGMDNPAAFPRFTPESMKANQPVVDFLNAFAKRKKATPAQIALAWLLAQAPWIVPIPGTRKLERMIENLGAAEIELSFTELREIDDAFARIKVRGARLSPEHMALIDR